MISRARAGGLAASPGPEGCGMSARAAGTAATIRSMTKRGYSREFRPHGDTGKRYLLDDIPAGLWSSVREKCKREGVSIRAQILKLLKDWAATDTKGE